jgi:hypothetical protein
MGRAPGNPDPPFSFGGFKMERLCELTVTIGGYNKPREKQIKAACMVEWSFREDDFCFIKPESGRRCLLQASSLGTLFECEDTGGIIARLERAIWRANNGLCHVEAQAREVNRTFAHESITVIEEEAEVQVA